MKTTYIYLMFCIALLYSCGEILDSEGNIRKEPLGGSSSPENYFPNSVGNYWQYNIIDKTGNTVDVLTVSVEANTEFRTANSSKRWDYIYQRNSLKNFKKYVEVAGNKVYEYDNPDAKDGVPMYELPIEVGKKWYIGRKWDGKKFDDSASVVNVENIEINDFVFEDAYQISVIYDDSKTYKTRELRYFVPFVGIVFSHYGRFTKYEERLELIDYDVE